MDNCPDMGYANARFVGPMASRQTWAWIWRATCNANPWRTGCRQIVQEELTAERIDGGGLVAMLERKAQGKEIITQPIVDAKPMKTGDLMDALEASLAEAKAHSKSGGKSNGRAHAHARRRKSAWQFLPDSGARRRPPRP